jgi:hypothetical protein
MLIEPASNVSVPGLTVVMTTRSNAPESETPPALKFTELEAAEASKLPDNTQVLVEEFASANVITPLHKDAAVFVTVTGKPVVEVTSTALLPDWAEYPEVVTDPDPIWIWIADVPLVLTPLNITVIRFTHDGIAAVVGGPNVMLVPLVDACGDPKVITLLAIDDITAPEMVGLVIVGVAIVGDVARTGLPVPVAAPSPKRLPEVVGSVSVVMPATAAACTVAEPDVDPFNFNGIRQYSKQNRQER